LHRGLRRVAHRREAGLAAQSQLLGTLRPRRRPSPSLCGPRSWETRVVAGTIPIKTPQGQAELSTRQRRVSQRHRTVLFLIDGKRSATEVRHMALQAGVPENCFDELLAMGL